MTDLYGFTSDEVKQEGGFSFGLNTPAFLKEFKWIPNAGKDGSELEALEIIFEINGKEKSYRQFPITKAFLKDGGETTDPSTPEFRKEVQDFNAKIVHILHAFVDIDKIKAALSVPIADFKTFCKICEKILPSNYREIPLDIFMQYQWQISDGRDKTYLEIPRKMSYGAWLCAAKPGVQWVEKRADKITESTRKAIYYVNSENEKEEHPFFRNGWFALSNFANQQTSEKSFSGLSYSSQNNYSAPFDTNETSTDEDVDKNTTSSSW